MRMRTVSLDQSNSTKSGKKIEVVIETRSKSPNFMAVVQTGTSTISDLKVTKVELLNKEGGSPTADKPGDRLKVTLESATNIPASYKFRLVVGQARLLVTNVHKPASALASAAA